MKITETEIAKFQSRFDRLGEDECWPWHYHANHHGHGRMYVQGRNVMASHIALELDGRPRPEGLCALHSCDNPPCVNPKHLRWGTQIENISDRVERGRNGSALGVRNFHAKLNEADVLEIRNNPISSKILSEKYGVSRVMICKIRRGESWTHVGTNESGEAIMPQMQPYQKEQARPLHERVDGGRRAAVSLP